MVNVKKAGYNRSLPRNNRENGPNLGRSQITANHHRAKFGTVMTTDQIAAGWGLAIPVGHGQLNRKERRALSSKKGA